MSEVLRSASAAAALTVVLALTGCFGAPTAPPETAPSAEPTPSAEAVPVDPITTTAAIVVRPEQLEFVDASGAVVHSLSYDAEAAEFVAALSTIAGAEPEQAEHPASMETPPRTDYTWPGVILSDDHEEEISDNGFGGYGPIDMNVSVNFGAPTLGDGVVVRTVDGFQPGGDAEALAAELGEPWLDNGYDQVRVETGEPIGPQQAGHDVENAYSVAVNTWEWQGASNRVFAPWNFGIGHV
ncbi:hypothetical protein [Agromyces sp. NPDC058104]|uniref:hypothetical protein n=1 Tax=Agromyces sp. NPDC058104 TaxID=3346342 RepID=UPI0036DCE44F